MQLVQIQSVSLDELVERLKPVVSPAPVTPAQVNTGIITICNKKEAAGTLGISLTLFDKLQNRGIIPATVYAGVNAKGKPIQRWCQHHLIAIKPVIDRIRHQQLSQEFIRAKIEIQQILGL